MRVRFRGITTREVMLIRGPSGWGEFGPFPEYGDDEAAHWLRSAIEAAWIGPPPAVRTAVPINATVPAIGPDLVAGVLARFPGATTAKVKVAERGQAPADDIARVAAVREHIGNVRVDANGGWTVDEACVALQALTVDGPLEYAEQPCASVEELVQVRRRLPHIRIAADESIRRAEDPLRVARLGGLDVAVVKVAPLGGTRRLLALARELGEFGIPLVVSSALDSAVGMNAGLAAAGALPELELACGLGTSGFFAQDVAPAREMVDGRYSTVAVDPEPERLQRLVSPPDRSRWWFDRLARCYARLADTI
ncbi:o-succinylbenzoate synthase [Antrihabitans sp. YC2-6]|uniref:o-succinylbenzoate synthase n=1 Tax=Antrihabitans sp. YC2-6 TaxID=2799498 RepID=UPI001F1FF4CD